MKRKNVFRVAAAAASLGLLVAACGDNSKGSSASGEQFVFVNYGGNAATGAEKGWLEPFSDKTGASFRLDSPTDSAKIRTMVESDNVTWDTVYIDASVGGANCGTLFEKRPADFDMSEIDPQYIADDCMVPVGMQAVALVYNKELYGANPPTSTADFMDTAKFPGKRVLWNYPVGTIEPLLAATGVPADEVEPLNWDKIEDALGALGNNLEFKDTLAQVGEAIEAGDYGMSLFYTGRLATLPAEAQENIGVIWDKTYVAWDGQYVVKGSKNSEIAMEFLQFLATKEGQAGYSKFVAYGPTTVGGLGEAGIEIPEGFKHWMPDFNADKITEQFNINIPYLTENGDEVVEQWTRIVSGG